MNNLCIVIRRAPYGSVSAAEAVRHVIGAVHAGLSVHTVLVDDGVYLVRQDQDPGNTGWPGLSAAPRPCSHSRTDRRYAARGSAHIVRCAPHLLNGGDHAG